jgi:hypothetical protein
MEFKKRITNEDLRKKFKSQFELVKYAISLAENMILTGREPRAKIEGQNRAMQILEEIVTGKDKFDEIPVAVPNPSADPRLAKMDDRRQEGRRGYDNDQTDRREVRGKKSLGEKGSKKGRKILAD